MNKAQTYRINRINQWESNSNWVGVSSAFRRYYHRLIAHHFRFLIPENKRILEIGCGKGGLLNALQPSFGVGIDFSKTSVSEAVDSYPHLNFICADAHEISIEDKFDFIILSDLVNDLWDVQAVLNNLSHFSDNRTRIIINSYSRLWQLPFRIAESMGFTPPSLEQNWFTVEDLENLLDLSNFEVVKKQRAILVPANLGIFSKLANRILVNIWPFSLFALTNIIVARPVVAESNNKKYSVSVIIPARNEEGNIHQIFERTPHLGSETEMIFVEGHSKDQTYQKIEEEIKRNDQRKARLIKQLGIGKADAVREGFAAANGNILIILDADLSVSPEDLTRFYDAIVSGKAEFINGVRLVYPMENKAMRSINLFGNKFFSIVFSWLLGQNIRDTLCGTKALWKRDYQDILAHWNDLGEIDPFGDFDLIFGATKLCLKISDLPIRYQERVYGQTNIDRWRHGLILLRMVLVAAKRLKFV